MVLHTCKHCEVPLDVPTVKWFAETCNFDMATAHRKVQAIFRRQCENNPNRVPPPRMTGYLLR